MWCLDHGIVLEAVHIPGISNVLADNLSRGVSTNPTEWTISTQVFQSLLQIRTFPTIDLFATWRNKRLPVFCSLVNDDRALAVDALSIVWTGMFAYAFPPIPMIHKILEKIRNEDCMVLLIAPLWPRQYWFLSLMELLVDLPILLPQKDPDLLRMPV
jgi:hypothetical protein